MLKTELDEGGGGREREREGGFKRALTFTHCDIQRENKEGCANKEEGTEKHRKKGKCVGERDVF